MDNDEMILDDLLDLDDGLTAWEVEFVDSLDKQRLAWKADNPDGEWEASPKQHSVLLRIAGQRL